MGLSLCRIVIGLAVLGAMLYGLQRLEKWQNPAGFDLEMQYRIQETQEMVKQSLENRTETANQE